MASRTDKPASELKLERKVARLERQIEKLKLERERSKLAAERKAIASARRFFDQPVREIRALLDSTWKQERDRLWGECLELRRMLIKVTTEQGRDNA